MSTLLLAAPLAFLAPQSDPVPVDLAALTEAAAAGLDGRLVRARVDLVDDGQRYGGWVCHGADGRGGLERSVWSRVRLAKGKGVVVGRLELVRHPPAGADPGWAEARLTAGD